MEQRRLRLGDILDDYCPRERRVTNHVIVAMVEDSVRHTRCSTCDADHEYRQARVPTLRKKREIGVLAGDMPSDLPRPRRPEVVEAAEETVLASAIDSDSDAVALDVPPELLAATATTLDDPEPLAVSREDDGPVHRRLIRATLPRPEGQVPERKEPDFTIRSSGRGEVDGNRVHNGQRRQRRRPGGSGGDSRFGAPHGDQGYRGGANGNRGGRPFGHAGQGAGDGGRHRRRGR